MAKHELAKYSRDIQVKRRIFKKKKKTNETKTEMNSELNQSSTAVWQHKTEICSPSFPQTVDMGGASTVKTC